MKIGVPKETAANERRVALTPDAAGRLIKSGFDVAVERGAGTAAYFPDEAYEKAGVGLGTRDSVLQQSDIILQVQPQSQSLALIPEGRVLVAFSWL
jgi:NAD(P) transhydrogenase subunit alpha